MKTQRQETRGSLFIVVAAMLIASGHNTARADWFRVDSTAGPGLVSASDGRAPQLFLETSSPTGFRAMVRLSDLELSARRIDGADFTVVSWPQAAFPEQPGVPSLPVLRRLFVAPDGAAVGLKAQSGPGVQVELKSAGFSPQIIPTPRPAVLEEGQATDSLFETDESAYGRDEFEPAARASVREVGRARGCRLFVLEVRPLAYNSTRGVLMVWPALQIDVGFGWEAGKAPSAPPQVPACLAGSILNPPAPEGTPRTGSNYLIIVADVFATSAPLLQFAEAKTAQGFSVTTYSVPAGTTKEDIKAYIEALWGTGSAPDYIFLVGDADRIPNWIGGGYLGEVTDLPYACMDGANDWVPDIDLGRITPRTVEELQAMVDKILFVEAGDFSAYDPEYARRAAFLAGYDELSGDEQTHNTVIDSYLAPRRYDSSKLYARTYGATPQDNLDAVNTGCVYLIYYGHSIATSWDNPSFPTDWIHNNLTNAGMYPVILSISCQVGNFTVDECLGEAWLRGANKGACAFIGPSLVLYTSNPPWTEAAFVETSFFDAIYTDGIREVGSALNAAKMKLLAQFGAGNYIVRDYFEMFVLFGDPSMQIPMPPKPNYLVVTAPDYNGSVPLNKLITAREHRGFNVSTYVVPPGTTNTAIKNYIHSLWGTAASPSYVVIIGDTGTTFNPPGPSTASTIPHFVGLGPRQGTTDWPYVCMDPGDDWYPEIPIGRLSVQNVAQLQAVVDKTLKVESGVFSNPDYVRYATFLANSSSDVAPLAEATHNWVINTYLTPNGYTGTKIYGSQGGNTAQVAAAVNAGSLFTVYMGHSDNNGWWNPQFYQSDINALTNNGLYGVAMGWSCHTAEYDLSECSGETWLRAANKGAAAYISASQFIYWGSDAAWQPSVICEKSFFTSVFSDGYWEIGPAWLNGMHRFLKDYGGWDGNPSHLPPLNTDICRDFMEEFVILGDPALLLPQLSSFSLEASPAGRSVCSPPATQTTFTILVDKLGSFAEPVTLSATGYPGGSTLSFSANSGVPPFTSTMTIGNLGSASVGHYDVSVVGTSATKQRSIPVTLDISSAIPPSPVLSSPPNGSMGVSRTPALIWQASSQAQEYELEVATDPGFANIAYTATVSTTSHLVTAQLLANTLYYWHVRATNGCGSSAFSTAFSFRTLVQADYFTQLFTSNNDMDNRTIQFAPDGSGNYYSICSLPITALPTDPAGGTGITSWTYCAGTAGDDCYKQITLSGGKTVALYGVSYSSFFVGTNGYITFSAGDTEWTESLANHFDLPRISALFDDLLPGVTGAVSWKQQSDRAVVTWLNVPNYGSSNQNTFQIELYFDGRITVSSLAIAATGGLAGMSRGLGVPADYVASDLSASPACGPPVTGACCTGETCAVMSQVQCLGQSGWYWGDNTTCEVNPCLTYDPSCLIISEVVNGAESGDCPRWIEITNTGSSDFLFVHGGLIVQMDGSTDTDVDVNLTGVVIRAGDAFVISSNQAGACTGAFQGIYGFPPDLTTNALFGNGDDRYILTDTANGAHLIDIYGEFGVDGTGRPWEYTTGYAYRVPAFNSANEGVFYATEWFLGGPGSLQGADLPTVTSPARHTYNEICYGGVIRGDLNCDGAVNLADIPHFVQALVAPSGYLADHDGSPYPVCSIQNGDLNHDGVVDGRDIEQMVQVLLGG